MATTMTPAEFERIVNDMPSLTPSEAGQLLASYVAKTVRAGLTRSEAWRWIEDEADRLRQGDGSVSQPQAIAKACDRNPALVAAYETAAPDPEPVPVAKAVNQAWDPIEKAASELQTANPRLGRAEAIVKVMDLNPALALRYEASVRA